MTSRKAVADIKGGKVEYRDSKLVHGLVVQPGVAATPPASPRSPTSRRPRRVLLRALEVGVCGTDREIAHGLFGAAPEDGTSSCSATRCSRSSSATARASRAATSSRRPCGARAAAAPPAPRAARRLRDGPLRRARDHAARRLRPRARRGGRGPADPGAARRSAGSASWRSRRRSAPGRCATRGSSASASPGRPSARSSSARARSGCSRPTSSASGPRGLDGLARAGRRPRRARERDGRALRLDRRDAAGRLREDAGGFDLVIEAAGDAQVMLDRRHAAPQRRRLPARHRRRPGRVRRRPHARVDSILENRAVFGSVNARRGLGRRRRALDRARRAGPTRSTRSSACGCRSTASTRRSSTAASRRRSCFDERGGSVSL